MTTRQQLETAFLAGRELRIREARRDFWAYCKLRAPEFYKESRWHLKIIAKVLQALYEKRLTKAFFRALCEEECPAWFLDTVDWERLHDDFVYEKMQLSVPPRMGKSRTLVMFTAWCFGVDVTNRVITASYNDDQAQEFSRFTRDEINEERVFPHEVLYEDVFPATRISEDNASYKKWALDGQFFSYKGAGIGGSVTGKGGNILIVDDPVKDAEEAFNELRLEKIWLWYTGTFLSRQEQRDNSIMIVNMTRWSKNDVCGRILDGPEWHEWFVLTMEAFYDFDGGVLLCEEILNRKRYESYRRTMNEMIFLANYHQKPVDMQGRLYKEFKTYDHIPTDENGNPLWEKIIAYADTADDGSDYLCVPIAGVYMKELYMLDVIYTKDGMEVTEPLTAKTLLESDVTMARIESNSGGKGFARNVERILFDQHKTRKVHIEWFHQSKNKRSRIMTNSVYVMQHIYMPADWRFRWPEYYKAMTEYSKEGKNKHDDAPDATTGLVEMMDYQPVVIEEPLTATYEDLAGDGGGLFDQLW